ncbi:hypothetical protein [Ruegeria sp. PrR005]|uniref:Uncharacterized protein n=1 Tax=Ruegeria sp. PrR005 TaxID=2706882 RepID=A0A6B2NVP1_9RHOB|nr:hypothetical protein [Ruegeria sp. PrR005]NDW47150.1 hypothetical protein [Ruegeria sp. PrR005]
MPEDAIGFEFFNDNQNPRLTIVNDAAVQHASGRLSNEIAHLRAFDHLEMLSKRSRVRRNARRC